MIAGERTDGVAAKVCGIWDVDAMRFVIALGILVFVGAFAALAWEIWIIHLRPQ